VLIRGGRAAARGLAPVGGGDRMLGLRPDEGGPAPRRAGALVVAAGVFLLFGAS
jgi:hypothetical protein